MELKEKVAFIKGLMEGMEFDVTTKEGKVLNAVVELLDQMADSVVQIDEDEDDYDEEYEAGLYEITCPNCGEVVCVDEDMLADENLACPNCGTKFEVDFSEEEDAAEESEE